MNKYFLACLPFLLFFGTYFYLIYYYQKDKIIVPQLIGALLTDLTMESNDNLIFKIARVTYNKEYKDNYIIGQYPLSGSLIRPNQIISLEVNNNKNKAFESLFPFVHKNDIELIKENYKKEGISYKIVNFNNKDSCLDQVVSVYDQNKNLMYLYACCGQKEKKFYIENLIGTRCNQSICSSSVTCYKSDNIIDYECAGRIIINQYPLPGIYSKYKNDLKIHVWHD